MIIRKQQTDSDGSYEGLCVNWPKAKKIITPYLNVDSLFDFKIKYRKVAILASENSIDQISSLC